MKYYVRGTRKQITLDRKDFIAQGGEGRVYGKGGLVYKIYLDPKRMISEAKIKELRVLDRPNILRPKEVVLDADHVPVGFTMDWVKGTVPLCKFFTNDFRNRSGVTEASTAALVEKMRETILAIHGGGCLMVDGNEFNYLVDGADRTTPFFIDVDSYQTPGFPATAIMPSIRDPRALGFSEESDWFSFAVVACQIFVGVHPFKGRHPAFAKNDVQSRMKAEVSIFNREVTLPPAARDLRSIPAPYRTWFVDLFERGKRCPPPALTGPIFAGPANPVFRPGHTDTFDIQLIREYGDTVLWCAFRAGTRLIGAGEKVFIGDREHRAPKGAELLFTPRELAPVFAAAVDGVLSLKDIHLRDIPFAGMAAEAVLAVENTLYVKNGEHLTEIALNEIGNRILPTVQNAWDIMDRASEIHSGVMFQSVLGKPFLVIPRPPSRGSGKGSCVIKPIPELEGYRIIDAGHDGRVCVIVGHQGDRYDRLLFKFDPSYDDYDCRIVRGIDLHAVNFITLENGIAVSLNGDGSVEVFSNRIDRPEVKVIQDPALTGTPRLCKEGNAVMFYEGKSLYRLRMAAS